MATYRVQIIKEFDMEIDAVNEAIALEIAEEQFEDYVMRTITVDELED